MKSRSVLLWCAMALVCAIPARSATKPRVIVLTDIENEPDDAESLVRFLVYSNNWDVEGLVATTSVHQKDKTAAWRIREIVQATGAVANRVVSSLGAQPALLVIVLLNLVMVGSNLWITVSQEQLQHEVRSNIIDIIKTCIRPTESR